MYAMLDHAKLSPTLWGEAALTAVYLFNHSELRSLPAGFTPYEMLHGSKPDVSHLCMFGARCFACIPPELQQKMGPRSLACEATFMGYPPGVKVYRCCDNAMGAFFNSRDVIFDESFSSWEGHLPPQNQPHEGNGTGPVHQHLELPVQGQGVGWHMCWDLRDAHVRVSHPQIISVAIPCKREVDYGEFSHGVIHVCKFVLF